MSYPYFVMRKGVCYSSTRKHHKKARFKKAFAREIARINKIFMTNKEVSGDGAD